MKTRFKNTVWRAVIQTVLMLTMSQLGNAASWVTNGPMITPRSSHTATLLANGKVLVTGGRYKDNTFGNINLTLASAELFDPNTGAWVQTASMASSLTAHSATKLLDGRVFVYGGGAEIYDPLSQTWANAGVSFPRIWNTTTLLSDGRVLVAGGASPSVGAPFAFVEVYNPISNAWTTVNPMNIGRRSHTATLLTNGQVLVVGGLNIHQGFATNTELYNPITGIWTTNGALNTGRHSHTATLLLNGKVLVVGDWEGGNNLTNAELYDPNTGTSTTTMPLNFGRSGHTATLLPDGRVLVVGGGIPIAELFDPTSGAWTTNSPLNIVRFNHTTTLFPNGNILVAGGQDFLDNSLPSTELYAEPIPIFLSVPINQPTSGFQFGFTNIPWMRFNALASTNPSVALSNWTTLGNVTEISPGQFQFTDPQATNSPQRFYRVRAN
jgi:Galactose oxidase, central domain